MNKDKETFLVNGVYEINAFNDESGYNYKFRVKCVGREDCCRVCDDEGNAFYITRIEFKDAYSDHMYISRCSYQSDNQGNRIGCCYLGDGLGEWVCTNDLVSKE